MNSLAGKVALITGSGEGMGRAHARLMAERGADIVVADINGATANETAEAIRSLGRKAHVEIVDMADVGQVQE